MNTACRVPFLLQRFFTERLMNQRNVSPHTIACYRDTFHLFLEFIHRLKHRVPSQLTWEDFDVPLIGAFLDHCEKERHNVVRTRNLRLAAIRSFFRYVSFQEPAEAARIQQILLIPNKRQPRRLIGFLTHPEVEALLAAPDQRTWSGRRDHTFLLLTVQTGLRLSEVTGLHRQDVILGTGAHVYCLGKGRKERRTPLAKRTVGVLRGWLREPQRGRDDIVFPNARGGRLSADGAQYLLAKHLATARQNCPYFARNASRSMCFAILRQWRCFRVASIPRRSHSGLGTNHLQLPTFTWMRIWRSKKKFWERWRLGMERKRDVTVRKTPS